MVQVIFAVNTKEEADLQYLDSLVARNPGTYLRSDEGALLIEQQQSNDFQGFYSLTRRGFIYVKIDDDIVFIQASCASLLN